MSKLIAFAIQFVFFLCFLGFFMLKGFKVSPNVWVLMTPVLLLMMAGFGLGLERLVLYMTGMENIRDAIPFPRVPNSANF